MENKLITHFAEFNLSTELMRGLSKMNFQTPSPVQAATIKPLLSRQDMLVQAPTGTGKTAAFGIPLVENIDVDNRQIQAVILCPTRELATQTTSVLKQLVTFKPGIRILSLYGGEPIYRQITALKRRPQIIVATPGRLMDHMNRRTARLDQVNCIILDEADRMLDMGFRDDIAHILQNLPPERQTVLFSATVPTEIKRIAATYQTDATHIHIAQEVSHSTNIAQYYAELPRTSKLPALIHLLNKQKFKLCLIFVATKSMADTLAQQLTAEEYLAESIHGDLHQRQRNRVMQRFRDGKISILIATDVAARGIDVDGIDAVINYDVPGDAEHYIHRIGRTGRAGQSGVAYTFIDARERHKLQNIMSVTKTKITFAAELFSKFITNDSNAKQNASGKTKKRPRRRTSRNRKRAAMAKAKE